jgi:sugar phosphate isomerase/epimerase
MKLSQVAVQLFTLRDHCKTAADFAASMRQLRQIGYTAVQVSSVGPIPEEEIVAITRGEGLTICATHEPGNVILEEPQRVVDRLGRLGCRLTAYPWPQGVDFTDPAQTRTLARKLDAAGAKLRAAGLMLGYHNHAIEFQPMDGELPWDTFFANTRPEVVMQFDTGNALHAGADAAPFISRYPGRATTVHLKEHSASDDTALLGDGDVPWPQIFQLCETVGGTEWYIVEHESYAYPPLECVDRCLQALKAMGK